MEDKIRIEGVLEKGYGLSPKLVMQDENLSIEAKAIYAYMASFAGNSDSAFPSISRACKDLNVSEKRFRRHRDQLVDAGYISIKRNENNDGKFSNNIYIIHHTVKTSIRSKHRDGELPSWQNDRTNNNSSFNNNKVLNSSSSAYEFYQQNFGIITPFISENINHWINDLSEELVIEAMKISLKAGKKFNYAEGVLRDWLRNNIRTLDDVKANENNFEKKRKKTKGRKVARF